MKRFLTVIFAAAFSGVALSAQDIDSATKDTLVVIVKHDSNTGSAAGNTAKTFLSRLRP